VVREDSRVSGQSKNKESLVEDESDLEQEIKGSLKSERSEKSHKKSHSEKKSHKKKKKKKGKKSKSKDKKKKKKGKDKKKKRRHSTSSSSNSSSDDGIDDSKVDYGSPERISDGSSAWEGRSQELYDSDGPNSPTNAYHKKSKPRILQVVDEGFSSDQIVRLDLDFMNIPEEDNETCKKVNKKK
jgi:hypothetical protein